MSRCRSSEYSGKNAWADSVNNPNKSVQSVEFEAVKKFDSSISQENYRNGQFSTPGTLFFYSGHLWVGGFCSRILFPKFSFPDFVPGGSWWDRKYDLKRPPEYKTEDKGDSFKDFINRHCGGEENLFQPVNGQSALEYAGLQGAESIGQSLSGIQRKIFKLWR